MEQLVRVDMDYLKLTIKKNRQVLDQATKGTEINSLNIISLH